VIAEARIDTEHASRYLVELCRQLDEKARAKPELGVRVIWTETDGAVDFGWGRGTVSAGPGTLTVRAEAADRDALREVGELISRHLEQHGDIRITWRQDGEPVGGERGDGRDAMRAFHRRMRH
jgi:hypothetical protein